MYSCLEKISQACTRSNKLKSRQKIIGVLKRANQITSARVTVSRDTFYFREIDTRNETFDRIGKILDHASPTLIGALNVIS
jgi:hypothetical protein